jgi:hypothetical protein
MTGAVSEASPTGGGTDAGTSSSPTARYLWTRSRALIAALIALLLFGVGYAVLRSGENHDSLDPRSADPQGTRAAARLLADRGVTSTVVTTTREAAAAAGRSTTLLVAVPDLLTAEQRTALHGTIKRAGGRTVMLAPGPASTRSLAPGAETAGRTAIRTLAAGCGLPAARRAGSALLGGVTYRTELPGADSCYAAGAQPTLLRLPAPGGDTVVLGSADFLRNEHLDEEGNASLALQLLGSRPKLVWYLPSLSDSSAADSGRTAFTDLIPGGLTWAFRQLAVAAVLAAVWRARRLGPVVTEQLPVVVRAAEATEGRARLYRRSNARGRAAETLRGAARDRIAPLVGVPSSQAHDSAVLTPAIAARLAAASPEPHALLYGPPPSDDASLLRLADELDALERSILERERYAP